MRRTMVVAAVVCALGVAAHGDTPTTQRGAAMKDLVLEGVPWVGYSSGKISPMVGSVHAALTYMGESPDYDELMCVSGGAFRRFYNRDDGGNVDIMYLGVEPARRAVSASGYQFIYCPPEREQMIAELRHSLELRKPAIGFGVIEGPPEGCVIAGMEDGGNRLVGWSYFGRGKGAYHRSKAWKPMANLGLVLFGEKLAAKPDSRAVLIETLRYAVDLERTALQTNRPDHTAGIAAMRAWADGLEVDADFVDGDRKIAEGTWADTVAARRIMIQIDQLAMLGERRHAAAWLKRKAAEFPEVRAELNAAAELYETVAKTPGVSAWGGGFPSKPEDWDKLRAPAFRKTAAKNLRKAADDEAKAVDLLEHALLTLSPLPEHAELKVPTEAELSRGLQRSPEDMALPRVFRGAFDVMRMNVSEEPFDDGITIHGRKWFVDPNQILCMGVSGEAFEVPLLLRPGEKSVAGTFLRGRMEAARRVLAAAGCTAEVVMQAGDAAVPELAAEKVKAAVMTCVAGRKLPAILLLAETREPSHARLSHEPATYLLVTGYEAWGDALIGWRCRAGGHGGMLSPADKVTVKDWAKQLRGAMIFVMPSVKVSAEQVHLDAVTQGVARLRGEAAGVKEAPPFLVGAAFYDAWAGLIAEDRTPAAFIDPLIWDLAERRWYASLFAERVGRRFPEVAEACKGVTREFMAIHDLMWEISRTAGGGQPGGGGYAKLTDPAVRKQVAELILKAKAHDASAVEKLEAVRKPIREKYREHFSPPAF